MVKLRKEIPGIPTSAIFRRRLSISGATAYWALKDMLKPKAPQLSGTLTLNSQRKVWGVKRVVGIAGTDEKMQVAEEPEESNSPDKVDLFLDNVGGSILDEVMMRMNPYRAICIVGILAHIKDSEQGT
ncbi:uncharacterized protein FOMMEDRAFT_156253 [Fomitiporia mediterranea MF3/22]|uniref:uncharacterized protein n=1 Tax=Fomitiporia mediterranea (strain MF3/22) TaxID=694068 RepID=UPI0004407603|nr:uncharacterized protein FOMMEDRAFT_156253 [Fomitiporia mediterranea MF3/22]EJD02890.1 hypothetical protein FOMMEDRAFT_156253 [Fomitiporia mediterranea MF3/22]